LLVLNVAVGRDRPELGLKLVDAPGDATAVGLELGFARSATADPRPTPRRHAARLLGQAFPLAPQTGLQVAELGQFDLGSALHARRVLGEDVQDHRGSVERGTA